MNGKTLSVAAPWGLSHYIPLNGFHPLYRALFEQAPAGIEVRSWDNVKLYDRFKGDPEIRTAVLKAAKYYEDAVLESNSGSVATMYEDFFWAPNQVLTRELQGDIEFHHTAPFPSLKRPFVFHCESFSPIFLPFSEQGSGQFENHEQLREHYQRIFSSPLCLGIFSHIPETLENLRIFFSDPEIDCKLFNSRIGLSRHSVINSKLPEKSTVARPRFLFVNSAHQNPESFFLRGGHIVLRFWENFRASKRDGLLILRCVRPNDQDLFEYGVSNSFLETETGRSIFWAQDYLDNHEMVALIASTHFFLLPTLSLHSVSIMQAMSLGSIPVVTDTVGTDVYVTDKENGIVLPGVKEANWYKDPNTGILVDRYRRLPYLDDSLVSQMSNRIFAVLDTVDAYEKMRNKAVAWARQQFSGEAFSSDFWTLVAKLFKAQKQPASDTNSVPSEIGQSLKDSILQEDDCMHAFESATQPLRRIYTGQSIVWELGGAFLHSFGNPRMEKISNWSVFSQHYILDAPKITFAKILDDLGGKHLSFYDYDLEEDPSHNRLTSSILRMSSRFPVVYAYVERILRKIRPYQKFPSRYRQFIYSRFKSNAAPDVELILHDMFGYNVVRFYHKYCAILEGEGEFNEEKFNSGGYSSWFSAHSVDGVLRKVAGRGREMLISTEIGGFNIIRFSNLYYAIQHSEGTFSPEKVKSGGYSTIFSGDTVDEVRRKISDWVDELFNGFNIIRHSNKYYAIPIDEGAFSLEKVQSGGFSTSFSGDTVDEVRRKISDTVDVLFNGFNIIRFSNKYYAIPKSEGAFSLEKAQSGGYSSSFSGDTVDEVRREIVWGTKPKMALEGFNGYNIIRFSNKYYAIPKNEGAFSLEKVQSGGFSTSFSGDTVDEVRWKISDWVDELVGECDGFNIIRHSNKYYAIQHSEGAFSLEKVQSGGFSTSFSGDTVDEVRRKISDTVDDLFNGFNIIRFSNKYYAIPRSEGAFSLEKVQSGGYSSSFSGDTVDEVRRGIVWGTKPKMALEGFNGYNIIRFSNKYYAIPKSEGAFSLEKVQSGGYSSSFSGDTVDEVRLEFADVVLPEHEVRRRIADGALPELLLEGFNGFNIIRLCDEFHAILQGEGEFEHSKALSNQYSCWFCSRSDAKVKELILASIGSAPNK